MEPENQELLQCNNCGLQFQNYAGLQRHIVRAHAPRSYKCPLCFRVYIYGKGLSRHLQNAHAGMNLKMSKHTPASEIFDDKDPTQEEVKEVRSVRRAYMSTWEPYKVTDNHILERLIAEQDWVMRGNTN